MISIGPVNPPTDVTLIAYGTATPPRPMRPNRTLAETGPSDPSTVALSHAEQSDHSRGDEDDQRAEEQPAADETTALRLVPVVVRRGLDLACLAARRA